MTDSERGGQTFRHSAREAALQTLYAMDMQRKGAEVAARRAGEVDEPAELRQPDAEELFDSVLDNFEMPAAAQDFARELVLQVIGCRDELDGLLASHTRNWRIDRMAAVDRNVLRLATFELCHSKTPTPVILDEAVELARRFGSETSPSFVNGVLDSVAQASRGAGTA